MTGPASPAQLDHADRTMAAVRSATRIPHVTKPEGLVWWPRIAKIVEEGLSSRMQTRRRICRHLARNLDQSVNVLLWAPAVLLCADCAFDPAVRKRYTPDDDAAWAILDSTCDACNTHRPGLVAPVVVQAQHVLVHIGMCKPCGVAIGLPA